MMKKTIIAAAVAALLAPAAFAQGQSSAPKSGDYKFTVIKENPITPVKNQASSGTCWCFSTLGFLESEIIRINNIKDAEKYPDLSEMYVVGQSYKDRAVKYIRTDGNIGFSAGSEGGDVLHVIEDYGIVPQSAMPGLQALPNHGQLDAVAKAYVDAIAKNTRGSLSQDWQKGFNATIDSFLGEVPETFEVDGKTYTPAEYRDALKLNPADYVSLTSFTHHPFYTEFAVEVADNWRWDTAYNVPIDEFMQVLYNAVEGGYTVEWGTDVSETGFTRDGIGVLVEPRRAPAVGSDQQRWVGGPAQQEAKPEAAKELPKEMEVTQESRQAGFDNKTTTDDHGMQIYGLAQDQNGTKYFMVKNSWGATGTYKGLWYVSDSFVRAKTIEIMVHKDALSKDLKKKLGIK